MNKLSALITELCPNGVEYVPLWSVTIWDKRFNSVDRKKQPTAITYPYLLAADLFAMQQESGDVFLLSTGEQTGWTTEEIAGKYLCTGEVVTMPWGKTRPVADCVKYYRGKFVTADNRIMTSNNTSLLDNKYLYYWFISVGKVVDAFYRGSGIQHPDMAKVLDLQIPVPPLEVQHEIVRILDTFTELTSELTENLSKELTARKQQYSYYRDKMLTFANGVKQMTIADICRKVVSGGTPPVGNSDYYGGSIPWLRTQEVDWKDITDTAIKITDEGLKNSSAKWIPANCVIVAMYGATAAKVAINKIPLTTNQACCNLEIDSDIALYRYVFHWLCKEYLSLKGLGQGSQSNINAQTVKQYKIPIPPLPVQQRIVTVLDNFDAICSDLNIGLPAEIEARKKQYEFYRDQLLTFAAQDEIVLTDRQTDRQTDRRV